ncbi:hypothetical protein Q8F55_004346 [Vanrija albida]|uniref:U6 snRNA phosphodiesterase 1 n=1 Tax=Vanrija albida TaxID=181172 RepID=A0ABR3Q6P2_9TREE
MDSLLAGYASSSSADDEAGPSKRRKVAAEARKMSPEQARRPKPKPKPARAALPSLPSSFSPAHDDPSAHQGRRRARPYTEGDYYAHIYAELPVPPALGRALGAVLDELRAELPDYTLHAILGPEPALHVSLSHPLPLRRGLAAALAPELAAAVRGVGVGEVTLSLAALAGYANTAGRAFAALRVGAGAAALRRLLDGAVAPVLERHHMPAYHADAEFHASFAWCLQAGEGTPSGGTASPAAADDVGDGGDADTDGDAAAPAVPFTPALLARLGAAHTPALLKAQPPAGWTITALCVKVARDVTRIPL